MGRLLAFFCLVRFQDDDGQYERKFAMSLACLLAHSSPFIAVMVTRRKKSTEASHHEREGRSRDEDRARYEQKRTQKHGTSLRGIGQKIWQSATDRHASSNKDLTSSARLSVSPVCHVRTRTRVLRASLSAESLNEDELIEREKHQLD